MVHMSRIAAVSILTTVVAAYAACTPASRTATSSTSGGPAPVSYDRLAQALARACPPADGADVRARDAAAEQLARCSEILDYTGERILWGGFDAAKGCDPDLYRLTEFSPFVWTKIYLSTFTFTGPHTVRQEGRYTVLEVPARFRAGLDPGDYAYPFWHSARKWQEYAETHAVLFVFDRGRLVAALRKADPAAAAAATAPPWDGHWRWADAAGHEQPRVALFSYLFSRDNPSLRGVDDAYRKLEAAFRSQNCISCHAPDNVAKAHPLTLLNYPNQALAARHTLVEALRRNRMPPADVLTGVEAGIADESARQDLLRLAEEFEREAEAALSYERSHATDATSSRGSTR